MSKDKDRLSVDLSEVTRFFSRIAEDGIVTFQVFDDTKKSGKAFHFTARVEEALDRLVSLNSEGLGIYHMVNEGDGRGRSAANVRRVRSLFLDLDGAPLEPVLSAALEPHIIIESSPGRFHAYWIVDDCPLEEFEKLQKAVARRFNGDLSVHDLPRVMRTPGLLHQKAEPYRSHIIACENFANYSVDQVVRDLELEPHLKVVEEEKTQPLTSIDTLIQEKIAVGDRHHTLLRYACKLAHQLDLGETERFFLLQGVNQNACVQPIDTRDLQRINKQATKYAETERAKYAEVVIGDLIQDHRKKILTQERIGFSSRILNPPGLVGDLYKYILRTSTKPQPELALAAALCACGTVMGRKIRTETNLRTNLYFLSLIETGGGKEAPRRAIQRVFHGINALHRAGTEELASDAAIVEALYATPSQVFLLDEYGRFLKATASDRAGSFEKNISTVFLKLFGSAGGVYAGKAYADRERNKAIIQPNASLLCTSVPRHFTEALTTAAVDDGMLNRFILMPSHDPDPEEIDVYDDTVPDEILTMFRAWEDEGYGEGNMQQAETAHTVVPEPRVLEFAPEAREFLIDFRRDLRERRRQLRREGYSGIFTRASENAQKIALVLAAGLDFGNCTIGLEEVQYGVELVMTAAEAMLQLVKHHVADSKLEANHKRICTLIRERGESGFGHTDLIKKSRWLDPKARVVILKELEELGVITKVSKPGRNGKPNATYFYSDYESNS